MGLETGVYISDLVSSNPVGASDQASTADDHLRLIKATLLATFPQITGAVNASQIHLNQLASGSLSASVVYANAVNGPHTSAAEPGYAGIPQNQQITNYTCVLADANKHIYCLTTSLNTITIPANGSVAYPIGTTLTFLNNTTINVSIAITTDNLYLAGTGFGTTGTRTLANGGLAQALKFSNNQWIISGSGLS